MFNRVQVPQFMLDLGQNVPLRNYFVSLIIEVQLNSV